MLARRRDNQNSRNLARDLSGKWSKFLCPFVPRKILERVATRGENPLKQIVIAWNCSGRLCKGWYNIWWGLAL
jgi:hypothetical protein